MAKNYVYFMQNPANGHIKIGQSAHPDKRKKQVQRDVGARLKILATLEDVPLERVLHERFDKYRLYGEWFRPAPELVKFIEANEGRADKWAIQKAAKEAIEEVKGMDEAEWQIAIMAFVFGAAFFFAILYGVMHLCLDTLWALLDMIAMPTRANVTGFMEQFFWVFVVVTVPLALKIMVVQIRRWDAEARDTADA